MNVLKFFILIVVSLGFLYGGFNAGVYSYIYYKKFQQNRVLKKAQEEIKKQEEAERQKLMADTYGGKTPQETLQMFISAVEKGDYELASRYFVIEKQKKELENIKISKLDDVTKILNLLKQAQNRTSGIDKNRFQMEVKNNNLQYPLIIDFILYPNGIWKLTDI